MQSRIAWLAAATHVIASFAMLLLLRRGLPGFPEGERLAYIASHRVSWIGGWLLWQIAAISLIAFYAVLQKRIGGIASVVAMCVATAGLAIDFICETQYIGVLPELRGAEFAALDRQLEVLIGYAANGLYTVALVIFVIAGRRILPRLALILAGPVAASGFALCAASLAHDARLETITSAILFPLFTLWILVVGLWLRRSE
ncbi:MAG TPA: hypothetical protein VGQ76_25460 [Thermoanaerobaculia bacterium]|nr:hypothetical protein [Thermoanaerobaculia bacterium]